MKALVTGATGFVGPHLVRHLREQGDDVVGGGDEISGFDVVDRDAVLRSFAALRPEAVYHLAALSHVGESWGDPIACLRVNVEGTANVLDAARAAGVRRVLVVGSAEEYGRVADGSRPVGEDTPLRPLTPYGVSKAAASLLALQASLRGGIETIRVRPFTHTGAGQSDRFVVPALAGRIAAAERAGGDTVSVGSLDPVRDLTDVRDVVRAYRLLILNGEPGEVYNVCRGEAVSVADIADRLVARSTRSLTLARDDDLVRAIDVPYLVGDPTRLVRATGWEPQFTLDDILETVLADARRRAQSS